MFKFLSKCARFVKDALVAFKDATVKWVKNLYAHAEAVVVSVSAGLGINTLLQGFVAGVVVPAYINTALVLPVLSTLIVLALLWSAQHRPRFLHSF